MMARQEHTLISARIVGGFLVVLALTASLSIVGLRYIADTNQRLRQITENNNLKTQLASTMRMALLERALSMHALSVMTDTLRQGCRTAALQQFRRLSTWRRAGGLEQLALNGQELEILGRISKLMGESNPEVQAVVDMGMEDTGEDLSERIRNRAIPKQRKIIAEVNTLIQLQQNQTREAVLNAERSYREVRSLMIVLGAVAMLFGLLITFYVSRRVAQQAKQLSRQALFDPLTGLPNRSLLQDRLGQAIAQSRRSGHPFSVALMDLNRFKEVNDTLGHSVGDELLREVSRRLKKLVRAEDTVARMGGDEFVLVLQGLGEPGIAGFSEKLRTTLQPAFLWGKQSIDIGASTGIALFPQHAEDASSLIRYADIAMYMAKRSGRDHAVYAPDQEQISREVLSLKSQLREAIQSDQLILHYQPKIDHRSCRVIGLEALARWNHPEKGLLAPDSFISRGGRKPA